MLSKAHSVPLGKSRFSSGQTKLFVLLFLAGSIIPSLLFAQFMQQGSKLVGSGASGRASQGRSVAISSDGNTAIEGGEVDSAAVGGVWVFTRSGGVWMQQGPKLVGIGAVGPGQQGWSGAISSDGNTAIEGAWFDNYGVGAVWVFTRSGGVWTQQGPKLVGAGGTYGCEQGQSVAISSDGNTAIVGGIGDNGGVGAVWIFTRSGSAWIQQGSKLVGTGAVGGSYQGISVAISSDGNTAIVGGYQDDSIVGAVWIFTRTAGVWTQQGPKLVGTGAVGDSHQGTSVAISSDGNTAIEGGFFDNGHAGAAWVFTRTGGAWTQQGPKLVGTGAVGNATQGTSVAIFSDGNTVILGGPRDDAQAGAIWIFARSGGVWTQQGPRLLGTGALGHAAQGWSVAVSSDGHTAIEGGISDNNGIGAVWVFTGNPNSVINISGEVPKGFSLMQNYPNPFNPSTEIRYQISEVSHVTLRVFDVLGREVQALVNEQKQAGSYEATFDAKGVSSGVYFYKLQANGFAATKKMIVTK